MIDFAFFIVLLLVASNVRGNLVGLKVLPAEPIFGPTSNKITNFGLIAFKARAKRDGHQLLPIKLLAPGDLAMALPFNLWTSLIRSRIE